MSEEKQDFLRRWSRRKLDSAASPPAKIENENPAELPPELPSVDSLTFDSDFRAFMGSKVEQGVKRAALKKLFADPRFNVMDGLDTYIDDYSIENPIPDEMMARLDHVRQTLFGRDEEKDEAKPAQADKPAEAAQIETGQNVDPAQDPKAL